MALEQEGPSSTGVPLLLDQPFIFTEVWTYLDASSKKALRLGCKPLRLAVDDQVKQVAWLAPLDQDTAHLPAEPSFFEAAGERWPNVKQVALACVADVQTLLSPSNHGGHAAFPRLMALTVTLVGAWLLRTGAAYPNA